MNKEQSPDFRQMTADTIGKDLLSALVTEIRLLPNVWQKLPKAKQDDVIERLRKRVEENVAMAVFTIAAQNRTTVVGDLGKVTIDGNIQAIIKFGINAANLPDLFATAAGQESKTVLVVVANAADYTQGMNEIKGEEDQRNIDLGHEYHDNDGGGMDGVSDVDPDTGEIKGLPSPDQVKPTVEEMQEAWNNGYQAAEDGKPQSDCPIIRSELVIQWINGWKTYHEDQKTETDAEVA